MLIQYVKNWCEYFTKCPNGKDCYVGDYDCCACQHHLEMKTESPQKTYAPTDYRKYMDNIYGHVNCNFRE